MNPPALTPPAPKKRPGLLYIYFILLLASFLIQLFFPPNPKPEPQDHLITLPAQSATGPIAGQSIHLNYRDTGTGEVVLLIHGSPGELGVFDRITPMLNQHFRIIAVDLPGFGLSDKLIPNYSNTAHARYLLDLMDHLHIPKAHILGFSMGGGVVITMEHMAPERINSVTLYGGIGVQEGEGSGSYSFEHLKYALGYAALVIAPEFLPHFGLLGNRLDRHAFLRNFWDTDQRPYRGYLEHFQRPLLILEGRNDPLVPARTAEMHHDIVNNSEFVLFDASHFMLFSEDGSHQLAEQLLDFWTRNKDGLAPPERRTLNLAGPAPVEPPPPVQLPTNLSPWAEITAIIAATFISEDLTLVTVGLLLRTNQIDLFVGILGAFFGIFIGDLSLWLLGRTFGTRILTIPLLRKRFPPATLDRAALWFDRQGWKAIFTARVIPGMRLPLYFAAGVVGRKAGRFILWSFLAALLWTPLLVGVVAAFGQRIVTPIQKILGTNVVTLALAAVIVYFALHVIFYVLTHIFTRRGRQQMGAKVSKLWRYEFWPTNIFYAPLMPYFAYLCLRYGPLTPTAANPGIPHSGIIGESKADILAQLPPDAVVPFAIIPNAPPAERTATVAAVMQKNGWIFPLILKPDIGYRGMAVRRIHSLDDATTYWTLAPTTVVAQVYHPGPFEAGVFYYRLPDEPSGHIFSITDKHFSWLTGDGKHTLEQLIYNHPRYRMQAATFLARHAANATRILAADEKFPLALAGNHCQGTMFKDGSHLITPALEARIDQIARHFKGFYFGRFDIRYSNPADLMAGKNIAIIELNGLTSESTNMYDPDWSLLGAYRTLATQWKLAFLIGAQNRQRGTKPTTLAQLFALLRQHRHQPFAKTSD